MQNVAENRKDALEEARLAVEEIVLPCGQAIELLPRAPDVLQAQVWPPAASSFFPFRFSPSVFIGKERLYMQKDVQEHPFRFPLIVNVLRFVHFFLDFLSLLLVASWFRLLFSVKVVV